MIGNIKLAVWWVWMPAFIKYTGKLTQSTNNVKLI